MSEFSSNTSKPVTAISRKSTELKLILISTNKIVHRNVERVISILGGTLVCESAFPQEVPQDDSAPDIYVVDPDAINDPARGMPHILDNRELCVVLYGGPAGLVGTRPAVCRVLGLDTGPNALAAILKKIPTARTNPDCPPKLSPRERETLHFYGRGMTLKAIGHSLGISAKSAETYKTRACRKLGLTDRTAALAFTEPSLRIYR